MVPKLTPVLSAISRYLNPDRYISKGMKYIFVESGFYRMLWFGV